jgi:hypothetical protein
VKSPAHPHRSGLRHRFVRRDPPLDLPRADVGAAILRLDRTLAGASSMFRRDDSAETVDESQVGAHSDRSK